MLSRLKTPNPPAGHPLSPRRPRGTGARAAVALVTIIVVVFAQDVGASVVRGSEVPARTMRLAPTGIGSVRFGLPKRRAVASLGALFGTPTWRGENTGCRPRLSEVEWGNLLAEFRAKIFTGYRYVEGGYPLPAAGAGRVPRRMTPYPRLATSKGITLGSTLAELRQRYGTLHVAGASEWQADNGLVFVDNAGHDPSLPSSRIIEIKIDTCGAF